MVMSADDWLRGALGLPTGQTPFPWQTELLSRFREGKIPRALDIPTGLGKTAVMAIWLVARALGAPVPRRLVYVVDRRAVVDQATRVAEELRNWVMNTPAARAAVCGESGNLPISTLRGQFVDNREWLDDPASMAVVVGTIDMIGSRILFQGYRTSPKMRPFHAAMLGCDTLVVLDEAHLVPPFEGLLQTLHNEAARFGPSSDALRGVVPGLALLSLSATGAVSAATSEGSDHATFGLSDHDLGHDVVRRRLEAPKRLRWVDPPERTKTPDFLAAQAWKLAEEQGRPTRIVVFTTRRDDARDAKAAIEKLGAKGDDTELFVGGRRVYERTAAASRLAELGFIAGTTVSRERSTFLFSTSAGEVGVDLDADHMVADLVEWERMVQRLGRVNRRGNGEAHVLVSRAPSEGASKALAKAADKRDSADETLIAAYDAQRRIIELLPGLDAEVLDASPGALHDLKARARTDAGLRSAIHAASTPPPLRPPLTRPVVDAWAMTSLRDHTGRPDIAPWLRGWVDEDPPQTTLIWRTHIPVEKADVEGFFEAAPPHASEVLESETFRVVAWLRQRVAHIVKRSAAAPDEPTNWRVEPATLLGVVLGTGGDLESILCAGDLLDLEKRDVDRLERALFGRTVVVDARVGGLLDGLLSDSSDPLPDTLDGSRWLDSSAPTDQPPTVPFRVRISDDERAIEHSQWRERYRAPLEADVEGEVVKWLIVDKWRHDAATEEDRSAGRPQTLAEHQSWAEDRASLLAERLGLASEYRQLLKVAARLHDEGKRASAWQRAFNAPGDAVYAKTRGPVNTRLLDGYRHELGSLPIAERDVELRALPPELQDLALHLIAAHHGHARPSIATSGCEDAPPSSLDERARDVALRFARLQKRWGPWGLAWWETLLRAADQQASRDNDARDMTVAGRS